MRFKDVKEVNFNNGIYEIFISSEPSTEEVDTEAKVEERALSKFLLKMVEEVDSEHLPEVKLDLTSEKGEELKLTINPNGNLFFEAATVETFRKLLQEYERAKEVALKKLKEKVVREKPESGVALDLREGVELSIVSGILKASVGDYYIREVSKVGHLEFARRNEIVQAYRRAHFDADFLTGKQLRQLGIDKLATGKEVEDDALYLYVRKSDNWLKKTIADGIDLGLREKLSFEDAAVGAAAVGLASMVAAVEMAKGVKYIYSHRRSLALAFRRMVERFVEEKRTEESLIIKDRTSVEIEKMLKDAGFNDEEVAKLKELGEKGFDPELVDRYFEIAKGVLARRGVLSEFSQKVEEAVQESPEQEERRGPQPGRLPGV